METPDIPNLPGITVMSPLQMNTVRFNKQHTVLTPTLLSSLKTTDQNNSLKLKNNA